jgi:hypothetical protein
MILGKGFITRLLMNRTIDSKGGGALCGKCAAVWRSERMSRQPWGIKSKNKGEI